MAARREGGIAREGLDLPRLETGYRQRQTELLGLLSADSTQPNQDSQEAIACYLSSAEGWDQALKVLGGAFASDAAAAVRCSGVKQNKHGINQRASEYLQRPPIKPVATDNV